MTTAPALSVLRGPPAVTLNAEHRGILLRAVTKATTDAGRRDLESIIAKVALEEGLHPELVARMVESSSLGRTRSAEPAEEVILRRIEQHPNSTWFERILLESQAYFLAHSPLGKSPVLRLKHKGGLAEWQSRRWADRELFPDPPPPIVPVTVQVLEVIESVLGLSDEDFETAKLWVLVEDGCRFVITAGPTQPPPQALPLWGHKHQSPGIEGIAFLLQLVYRPAFDEHGKKLKHSAKEPRTAFG